MSVARKVKAAIQLVQELDIYVPWVELLTAVGKPPSPVQSEMLITPGKAVSLAMRSREPSFYYEIDPSRPSAALMASQPSPTIMPSSSVTIKQWQRATYRLRGPCRSQLSTLYDRGYMGAEQCEGLNETGGHSSYKRGASS